MKSMIKKVFIFIVLVAPVVMFNSCWTGRYCADTSNRYGRTTISGNIKDSVYIFGRDKFHGLHPLPTKIDIRGIYGKGIGIGKYEGEKIVAISADGSMEATTPVKTKFYASALFNFIPWGPLGLLTFIDDVKEGFHRDCKKTTKLTFHQTNNSTEVFVDVGKQLFAMSSVTRVEFKHALSRLDKPERYAIEKVLVNHLLLDMLFVGKTEFDHALSLFNKVYATDKNVLKNSEWLALYRNLGDTALVNFENLKDAMLCYKNVYALSNITSDEGFEFWSSKGDKIFEYNNGINDAGKHSLLCYQEAYKAKKLLPQEAFEFWDEKGDMLLGGNRESDALQCYESACDLSRIKPDKKFEYWSKKAETKRFSYQIYIQCYHNAFNSGNIPDSQRFQFWMTKAEKVMDGDGEWKGEVALAYLEEGAKINPDSERLKTCMTLAEAEYQRVEEEERRVEAERAAQRQREAEEQRRIAKREQARRNTDAARQIAGLMTQTATTMQAIQNVRSSSSSSSSSYSSGSGNSTRSSGSGRSMIGSQTCNNYKRAYEGHANNIRNIQSNVRGVDAADRRRITSIQKQMRQLRQEAASKGCSISVSSME
jgi:hypothetical protein